jgi:hypothetical protein
LRRWGPRRLRSKLGTPGAKLPWRPASDAPALTGRGSGHGTLCRRYGSRGLPTQRISTSHQETMTGL